MEREFVPYNLALELKELGFFEECLGFYIWQSWNNNSRLEIGNDDEYTCKTIKAPLYQQAFGFFREKYNIHYAMKPILGSKNGYDSFPILGWDYDIFITNKGTQNSYYMGYPVGEWFTATLDMFDESETLEDLDIHPLTYEEAEVECLVKLIEIAKEQNVK